VKTIGHLSPQAGRGSISYGCTRLWSTHGDGGARVLFRGFAGRRQFKTIGRTVTEANIANFVNCTGMVEVLFTNLEFLAHESDIKQRLAPAALVYAFAEGLLVQATMQHTGFAFLHMELNVENPVFAGDTIHAECEVIEARRSRSRPDRGLVRTRIRVKKQDGTVALTYTPLRMLKCRELGV
jgi:acyl dehydratase